MYRLAKILTRSPTECLFYPGRIIEIRTGLTGIESGIIYYSGGAEIFTPTMPDFEFKFID